MKPCRRQGWCRAAARRRSGPAATPSAPQTSLCPHPRTAGSRSAQHRLQMYCWHAYNLYQFEYKLKGFNSGVLFYQHLSDMLCPSIVEYCFIIAFLTCSALPSGRRDLGLDGSSAVKMSQKLPVGLCRCQTSPTTSFTCQHSSSHQ